MRRTGWDLMFDGTHCDFLVILSELLAAGRDVWDAEDNMPHTSPPEDEARLRRIVSAVDGVFDRCEDTIRSMDVSMRCWLRSSDPHRPYKAPFELVGRQATTYTYRRLDLTLRLLYFLMTEEFEDGQSKSTLLVYFSGVLGLTSDGSGFRRPGNYTTNLSALIYCARLVVVEVLLPRTGHDYVGYPARPRHGQLDILNRVRRKTMCLASQAPLGEFLSLRAYGRAVTPADGPSFRFNWSDDGQIIS
ncbi:hypothetical protein CMUS01_15342 [Colletotrichum musicola]|uniref:Uncharacterized protein n=1 Tax=Colletotrichum musicola TaxID=2175873 RepID=A0A8H6IX28_9PEZI|nr:hypothetical protein CMUS01_15342 [Colletotrichum musicola]